AGKSSRLNSVDSEKGATMITGMLTRYSSIQKTCLISLGVALLMVGSVGLGQEQFRVASTDLPTTLDPPGSASNTGIRVQPSIFETLIRMNPEDNSQLEPGLAESWERIDDNTLELQLRKDVQFHNGDPFTSEDVRFSFERILEPDSSFTLPKSLLSTISEI